MIFKDVTEAELIIAFANILNMSFEEFLLEFELTFQELRMCHDHTKTR